MSRPSRLCIQISAPDRAANERRYCWFSERGQIYLGGESKSEKNLSITRINRLIHDSYTRFRLRG